MPAYNVEKYVGEAIESILNQTYKDFEFIIFNDGSTDNTAAIIGNYKDERIRFFNYARNSGYVAHLNQGISIAEGRYIARMDADDISDPQRLQKQFDFMEANAEVGICGTWYDIIGDSSNIIRIATEHADLKVNLLINSVFGHPSVMIRSEVLKKHQLFYDHSFMPAEDFKLWVELSRVAKLANLGEVLLHYRVHEAQISNYKKQLQKEKIESIRELQIEYLLGSELEASDRKMVAYFFSDFPSLAVNTGLKQLLEWSQRLIKVNHIKKLYHQEKLGSLISERIRNAMFITGYERSLLFCTSKKLLLEQLDFSGKLKFYLKCVLNWQARIPH
jgi:glycosyltransferase involved in cell wall biosynthesis